MYRGFGDETLSMKIYVKRGHTTLRTYNYRKTNEKRITRKKTKSLSQC